MSNNDLSDKSVEELFEKTDAYIAQIRDNLSAENTDDTIHFVDARSPDTTFKVVTINFESHLSGLRTVALYELLWQASFYVIIN